MVFFIIVVIRILVSVCLCLLLDVFNFDFGDLFVEKNCINWVWFVMMIIIKY